MRAARLALTLLCLGPLAAQAPAPPPRPPEPVGPESPTRELLSTLRDLRLARHDARRRKEAFEQERQVLAQEIAALEARLRALQEEERRIEAETRAATERATQAEERAQADQTLVEQMARALERARPRLESLVVAGGPALVLPERNGDPLRLGEGVAALFRGLEILTGRLREVAVQEEEILLDGQAVRATVLRLGGLRLWRGLDGRDAGWIGGDGLAKRLPARLELQKGELERAVDMVRRRRSPALVALPIPLEEDEQ